MQSSGLSASEARLISAAARGAALRYPWSQEILEVRRAGLEVVVGIDEEPTRRPPPNAIRAAIRAAHPSVDRMIRSGLVGDIGVRPVSFAIASPKRTVEIA